MTGLGFVLILRTVFRAFPLTRNLERQIHGLLEAAGFQGRKISPEASR